MVYGEKLIAPDAPTVLVYGHYDVQPADPLELWDSPAFEPIIKKTELHPEGAIFARGACDDKGQMFMHIKALEAMVQSDALHCNIKFMIEGEEEVDVAVQRIRLNHVEVTGPNRDLHSGLYGGAAPNPINILCEMIASLKNEDQRIMVDGFYDDVVELSAAERTAMAEAPFDEEEYKSSIAIGEVEGEKGYSAPERMSIRPTLDVNGIWGGYTGDGAKTVIASKASAKISMRLVPDQDPETITSLFEKHFNSIAPPSVSVKITPMHGGQPAVTPTDSVAYQAASAAMESSFGRKPVPFRGGGSIPIVASFEQILGLKTVLMGFGLDSDAIHSPNEHYGVFNYFKGIETIPLFHENFARLSKKG